MNTNHFSTYRQIEFAQIAIDSTQVSGRGGSLAPRLQLPAKLTLSPLRGQQLGFLIQELTGDVVIGHAGGFVTRLVPSTIQKVVIGTGCDHHLNLVLPIEHHQLEAIEQTRNCGDVALHLQLTLTYLVLAQPTPSTTTDIPVQVLVDGGVATASVDVKIPQSVWTKEVLRGTAFGELLIFEMPAFPVSSLATLGEAFQASKRAQSMFNAGEYDQAVGFCRVALQPLRNHLKEIKDKAGAGTTGDWAEKIGSATFDWLTTVAGKTHGVGSVAFHEGSTGRFNRFDAQMIVSTTISVLAYAARLEALKKPPSVS